MRSAHLDEASDFGLWKKNWSRRLDPVEGQRDSSHPLSQQLFCKLFLLPNPSTTEIANPGPAQLGAWAGSGEGDHQRD